MTSIELTILGHPAPQGSKAYKGMVESKKTGRQIPRLVEVSKRLKPWRKAVMEQAIEQKPEGWVPLDGPLIMTCTFYMPRPSTYPKTIMRWPAVMPDGSKLLRSTEDSLTQAGIWIDDARVVEHHIYQEYAIPAELGLLRARFPGNWEVPGALIIVSEKDTRELGML